MQAQTELPAKLAKKNQADLSHWTGNWIWRAIQCLIESPDFDPSPSWSAKRLNIPVTKVVEALEGLERLGIISRKGETYKVNSNWFQVGPKETSSENLLLAHTKLAPQILSKLTPKDKFTVQFLRGNRSLLNKYAPKFIALFKEMDEDASAQGLTEVIASEISFAILTNEDGGVK